MTFPLPSWGLEDAISFGPECSGDIVGTPAIAIDAFQNTYFATIAYGFNDTASLTIPAVYRTANNVVVGCVSTEGKLLWYTYIPELTVLTNQSSISLIIGINNDIYIAFVTPGAMPGCVNMSNTPIFCPCANPGINDIVVARLNYTSTGARLAWRIQNAEINSCSNESVPKLAIDTKTGLLYIAVQTSGNILCYTPVGAPNIAIICLTLGGILVWTEERNMINSTGANTNPVIVADSAGGVYLAYETTSTVEGGATITSQQVEVVKFQTVMKTSTLLNTYSRSWVLSQNSDIRAVGGTCSSPTLTCDNVNIYLAFLTTGSVGGNTHTVSKNDLVVCGISFAGFVLWTKQGTQFNREPYTYLDAGLPYITTNVIVNTLGTVAASTNVYVSLQMYSNVDAGGQQNTFIFSMVSTTGQNNVSIQGLNAIPIAYTGAASSSFSTQNAGTYSQLVFSVAQNFYYLILATKFPLKGQIIRGNQYDLALIKYVSYIYYPSLTPFQFMTAVKTICNCGANCSCSSPFIIPPDAPTDLVSTPGNGSATISFTQSDGIIIFNYAYSLNGVTYTRFSPPVLASPVTIRGLTNGITYTIRLKSVSFNSMSAASLPVTVTPIPDVPNAPVITSGTSGNTTATIVFTQGYNGGSNIINYSYSVDNGETFNAFSPSQTASPFIIGGLTNNVTYTIKILATNSIGDSAPSNSVTVTPVPDLPGAPIITNGSPGNTQAIIEFILNYDGGTPILNYSYSLDGLIFNAFSPSQFTSPLIINGLTNGVTYPISIRAINSRGSGPPSLTVIVTPMPDVPNAPVIVFGIAGNATATIVFTQGYNGGSNIINYSYSVNDGATFNAFSPPQLTSPLTINGLTNGVPYLIKILATNSRGDSTPSNMVVVIPSV